MNAGNCHCGEIPEHRVRISQVSTKRPCVTSRLDGGRCGNCRMLVVSGCGGRAVNLPVLPAFRQSRLGKEIILDGTGSIFWGAMGFTGERRLTVLVGGRCSLGAACGFYSAHQKGFRISSKDRRRMTG